MKRRSGMTLVEVLVAIFVMGIGLIALLTLFPIGMLRMARAIHDELTAQSAQNATTNAIAYNLIQDTDVNTDPAGTFNITAFVARPHDVFENPMPRSTLPPQFPVVLMNAEPFAESYPILVDPIASFNLPAAANGPRNWVGGSPPTTNALPRTAASHQGGLRRRPAAFLTAGLPNNAVGRGLRNQRVLNAFTLWDDMSFEYDAAAGFPGGAKTVGGTVLRDPRFSWAYTMQRAMTSDKSVVNCSVVVFDKRSLSITTNAAGNGVLAEYVYAKSAAGTGTFFNPSTNTISIEYTNPSVTPPPIRPGNWIMDVTPYNPSLTNANGAAPVSGSAHAYWYRVVSAEDVVIPALVPRRIARYEVQQPVRGFQNSNPYGFPVDPDGLGFQGTLIFMEGVAEVMDRGAIRLP